MTGSTMAGAPLHSGERGCPMTGMMDCCAKARMKSDNSEILRFEDLARSLPARATPLFVVAPDARERGMAQLNRPAFREDLANISLSYIPFGDLCEQCDPLCKFGEDHTILRKIARDSR